MPDEPIQPQASPEAPPPASPEAPAPQAPPRMIYVNGTPMNIAEMNDVQQAYDALMSVQQQQQQRAEQLGQWQNQLQGGQHDARQNGQAPAAPAAPVAPTPQMPDPSVDPQAFQSYLNENYLTPQQAVAFMQIIMDRMTFAQQTPEFAALPPQVQEDFFARMEGRRQSHQARSYAEAYAQEKALYAIFGGNPQTPGTPPSGAPSAPAPQAPTLADQQAALTPPPQSPGPPKSFADEMAEAMALARQDIARANADAR